MLKPLTQITAKPSTGVASKPAQCRLLCPYFTKGSGFVDDYLPEGAKVLFMISNPSSDDLVSRKPLSGKAGWSFLKTFIEPLGYGLKDYGVCSLMRCRPQGGQVPIGWAKKATINACRYYDQGVVAEFGPKSYLISHALKDIYRENSFHSLLASDIKKAFRFADLGLRPIVLMGQEAAEFVAPYIVGQGGVKKFRGSWMELDQWPYLSATGELPPAPRSGFTPARY